MKQKLMSLILLSVILGCSTWALADGAPSGIPNVPVAINTAASTTEITVTWDQLMNAVGGLVITNLLGDKGSISKNETQYAKGFYPGAWPSTTNGLVVWENDLVRDVDGYKCLDGKFSDFDWPTCPRASYVHVPTIVGHTYVVHSMVKGNVRIEQIRGSTGALLGSCSVSDASKWVPMVYCAKGDGTELIVSFKAGYITPDCGYFKDVMVLDITELGDGNLTENEIKSKYATMEYVEGSQGNAGGTSYDIEVDGSVIDNGTSTSYTHTGLTDNTAHTYRIRAKNAYGASEWTAPISLPLMTNDSSNKITLSASSVNENVAPNTIVGTLSSKDSDASGVIYSFASGTGDSDNAAFNISGSSLRILNSPDFEAKSSYSVRICSTNQAGEWNEKVFNITIANLNDAPLITSGATGSFAENGSGVVYTATGADDDGNAITWSISGTDAGLFNINSSTGALSFKTAPNFESPADRGANNIYDLTITVTDNGTGNLTATKAIAITVTNVNEAPIITTNSAVSVTEGSTTALTAVATDPEGSGLRWSISGGADQGKFGIVADTGVVTFSKAPWFGEPKDADAHNDYIIQLSASDGTFSAMKTVLVTVTQRNSDRNSATASTTNALQPLIFINGQKLDVGTASLQTTGGQVVTTIKVDDARICKILDSTGTKPNIMLQTNKISHTVISELNGQTVKNMEKKEAVLELKTEMVSYTLPAAQINIDNVSSQMGENVTPKDIKVSVKIIENPTGAGKIVEHAVMKNNFLFVVNPVEFEIICTSGNKTVEVSQFHDYVERTVAIPDGVDPAKITTGIVLNSDGSFRHVPTSITKSNGKYYAKISSLTNSTYSVIWNPVTFADVTNHWAKDAVNDMGSRMVVTGVSKDSYEPDRSITRAEFAAIVVRALGLAQGTKESSFGDVSQNEWFNGYVYTATAYALITGFDSKTFAPKDTITREQSMTILARAMKSTGLKVTLTDAEVSALLAKYEDGSAVSDYAKASVAICLKSGVVTGSSATTLSPKAYVTRAEVAVMAQQLLQKLGLINK